VAGFRYHALDAQGKLHKGVIETDSPRQVRVSLRDQGLTAIEVENLTGNTASDASEPVKRRSRRRMSVAEVSLMTRQFATLLGAGLTVEQTMNALIEQTDSQFTRHVLAGVRGQTLSRAMAQFPNVFPDLYRTLVNAGEQSGQLAQVMTRLADYTESRHALRMKVILALVYPAIVLCVALGATAFLLTYVVPKVIEVFENTRQTLPLLTRAMIAASGFLRATGIFWLIGIAAGLWLFSRAIKQPALRMRWHSFVLRLPLIGRLTRGLNTARLASTLAILVGSRVPLLTALQAGVGVVNNLPMKRALEETERKVREGASLSRSIGSTKTFPPVMVHLIASGESSGKLDEMLERVASTQTMEVENRVSVLTSLVGPLMILFMGGVVLLIVLAILQPIFEINQLVR
jgi:general secretion pathway protein F